jgi:hypothetical protein
MDAAFFLRGPLPVEGRTAANCSNGKCQENKLANDLVYHRTARRPLIYSVQPLQGAGGQVLVRGVGFGSDAGRLALDVNGSADCAGCDHPDPPLDGPRPPQLKLVSVSAGIIMGRSHGAVPQDRRV